SMKPPAPGPVSGDSATNDMSIAATAASTAFPPSRSARAPASAVSGCPPATTPFMRAMLLLIYRERKPSLPRKQGRRLGNPSRDPMTPAGEGLQLSDGG